MVDESRVGGSPVQVANCRLGGLEVLEDELALSFVALKDGRVDAGWQGAGWVPRPGLGSNLLVQGGGVLERERGDVGADCADYRVGARLLGVVSRSLFCVVGGVGEQARRVGGEVGGDCGVRELPTILSHGLIDRQVQYSVQGWILCIYRWVGLQL